MAEVVHAPALEGVDADPFELELALVAQHRLDARNHLFGLLLFLRVGIPTELEIDAEDVVGLAVQQHRLVAVEGWVEPEPAFGREIRLHHHIGDEEAIHEDLAFDVQPEHGADRAARAVSHHQPVGLEMVDPVWRLHLERHHVLARAHRHHVALPAHLELRQGAGALHQVVLEVILLQVDHARPVMVGLGAEVEIVDLVLAEEGAAHVPGHPLGDHLLTAAEPVEHFEGALCVAHAARADRHGVVVVDQEHTLALHGEVNGGGEAHRARADHHNRVMHDLRFGSSRKLRRASVFEFRILVGTQHDTSSSGLLEHRPPVLWCLAAGSVAIDGAADGRPGHDRRWLAISLPAARATSPCRAGRSRCADA